MRCISPFLGPIALGALFCGAADAGGNRDALRQIVQDQCVVHWLQAHEAHPCEVVYLPDEHPLSAGFAVLKDRKGGAHFLLIPTRTIRGLESPELLENGAPNYFAAAWRERDRIAASVGHPVPREAIGLAANPLHARSQDQFHIHMECVRPDVAAALNKAAGTLGDHWSPVRIGEFRFHALRIMGEELNDADPVRLLAERLHGARGSMPDYTLIVAGYTFPDGPGFIVLAGKRPAGELLLDSSCAIVTSR